MIRTAKAFSILLPESLRAIRDTAIRTWFQQPRHSRRQKAIAFLGGFHGRTMGALTLTGSKSIQKKRFGPLVPGVMHVPSAHCYRCAYNQTYPDRDMACVNYKDGLDF